MPFCGSFCIVMAVAPYDINCFVLAGLAFKGVLLPASPIRRKSSQPHRRAALGARWMYDIVFLQSGLKLAHGDTCCHCAGGSARSYYHRRLTLPAVTILKRKPQGALASVRKLTEAPVYCGDLLCAETGQEAVLPLSRVSRTPVINQIL